MKARARWRSWALWAGLSLPLASLGCPPTTAGGGARRHAQPPSEDDREGIALLEVQIELHGPAVRQYGGTVEHALGPAEQAVADAMADLPMTHAPALSRMVRELATTTPDRINVPPALVDGLMAWSGLVDPPPRLVVVEMPSDPQGCHLRIGPGCQDAVTSLVQQVRTTLPDAQPLWYGVGVVGLPEGATRMMVAVLEPAVELEPLPLAVGRQGAVTVAGRLLGPRREPRVEVVGPGGQWTPIAPRVAANGSFSARVACEGSGAHQVEVLAEGTHGVEVVANFPLWCGVEPPQSITVVVEQIDPAVTPEQIARVSFLHLNEERRRRGLAPLQWSAEAAAIAHGHSVDMREHGFVGHTSPTTGDVTARFSAAGLGSTVIRENVARGYGPRGIHDSLMNSPGHRVNILATDVTHVGIGVEVGEPETNVPGAPRTVFATQNFYREPGAGAPTKDLGPALQARVDARREELGLPPVRWSAGLSTLAQRNAEASGRGRPPAKDWQEQAFALGYVAVESHSLSSIDYEALVGVELWTVPALEAGVGVVRTKEPGGGEGFLAVVLVAERP